jgi:predicted Zn finger-like uncharacterized protein
MIVECEECKAKFKLDDSKITEKGIKVRCSKCKHVFTVKKPSMTPDFSLESASPSEDPFQDFSFSDDIDLGGEEASAAKEPDASTERPPETPSSKLDFSMGSKEDLAPPSEKKPPAKDEFADFDFDEDSFDVSGSPAPEPSASAPDSKEWGEVSLSEDMPQMPDEEPAGDKDFDFGSKTDSARQSEESFGDFKFDDGGELPDFDQGGEASPAGLEEPGGFVRSDRSRAPVRDELEASLDVESEAPAAASVPVPSKAPGKPVIRHAAMEQSRTPLTTLLAVIIAALAIAGILYYLNYKGTFTFNDIKSGNFSKLKDVPAIQSLLISLGMMEKPDTGTVEVLKSTVKLFPKRRSDGRNILVFTGKVQSTFRKPKSFIQVEVKLFDKNKQLLTSRKSYCDVTFTQEELATLDRQTIESFMNGRSGRTMNNVNIKQGQTLPFTVVFFNVHMPSVEHYKAEVSHYIDADAMEALESEPETIP